MSEPNVDVNGAERLRLIEEGAKIPLLQAVGELLASVDDTLRGSGQRPRPPEAHGGAYVSRWRFERLRKALKAAARSLPREEPPPAHGGRPMTLRECMDAEDGGAGLHPEGQAPAPEVYRVVLHPDGFGAVQLDCRGCGHPVVLVIGGAQGTP